MPAIMMMNGITMFHQLGSGDTLARSGLPSHWFSISYSTHDFEWRSCSPQSRTLCWVKPPQDEEPCQAYDVQSPCIFFAN